MERLRKASRLRAVAKDYPSVENTSYPDMKVLGASVIALVAALGVAEAGPRKGRVCFDRAEDGGVMNLQLVRLLATRAGRSHEVAHLKGGESSCVDLEAGAWSFEARSTRPYDPAATDPNACRSRVLPVRVADQKDVRLTVSPQSKGSEYICGWDLR
jgi:hypothetical protein